MIPPRPRILRTLRKALALTVLGLLAAPLAFAHMSGVDHLRLELVRSHIRGQWDIHLHDARLAVGLDPLIGNDTGFVGLQPHEAALRETLLAHVHLTADGRPVPLVLAPKPMVHIPAQGAVQFDVSAECGTEPRRMGLSSDLLWRIDPKHRAYFNVQDARTVHAGVFKFHGDHALEFEVFKFDGWYTTSVFVREGIGHIWSGIDHVFFLLALLLPAALLRIGRTWEPRSGFWRTTREVVKVVTAFTLAHSITLGLAFFGVVTIPSRIVESGIALSVFAAAWNNLRPFLPGRAWILAFVFGLVHGLGFAAALANLMLPAQARALALASFNVGVEIGQLAIVLLVLPVLYLTSRRRFYPRWVMGIGSLVIAWMAVLWFLDRGFGISYMTPPRY